jgi:G3E family GTPase
MLNAIEELASRGVDHIVIEATGVASPEEMLDTFADPSLRSRFTLGPMTTVVDAAKFPKLRAMLGPFFEAQIVYADLLILNKIDLALADDIETVKAEVRELNPEAVVRLAERCDINLSLLMAGPPSAAAHFHHDEHDHGDHEHDHRHAPADSMIVDVTDGIPPASLERFFARLPEDIWRAKGFVRSGGRTLLVQYAMGELEVTPSTPRDRHYLVFIGKNLDRPGIARELQSIQSREAAA